MTVLKTIITVVAIIMILFGAMYTFLGIFVVSEIGISGFLIGLLLLVIGIVMMIFTKPKKNLDLESRKSLGVNPLDILKSRYAKGEITKEEFDSKRKDLE